MFRSLFPAVAVALAAASAGRADTLDEAIATESKTLVKMLAKAGYQKVGTLPFGLKIGDSKRIEMNGGAINGLLPEYIETALVQATVVKKELTLLRNAAREAVAVKGGDPNTADGRKKLLEHKYPTWSGKDPQAPDVLLSGVIALKPDLRTANVYMIAVDTKSAQPPKLHEFPVECDQFLLSDCGIGVSYTGRAKGVSGFTKDLFASIEDDMTPAKPGDKPMTTDKPPMTTDKPPMGVGAKPTDSFPVELRVLYDGEEQVQEVELGGSASGLNPTTFRMKQPKEKQAVLIKMKNLQKHTLGAVVMVGGISTLNGHANWKDSERWVLEPGKEATIRGFYRTVKVDGMDKDVVDPFEVISKEASVSLFQRKGESAGRIELHVFQPVADDLVRESAVSLRQPEELRNKPAGGDDAEKLIEIVKTGKGKELIDRKEGRSEDAPLETGKLGKVARTDTKVIKYYTRDDAK